MWRYAIPLMLLSGCATLAAPPEDNAAQLKAQVARSEAQLRALVMGLENPAGDEAIATVAASLDSARAAVAGHAATGGGGPSMADAAGLVALGVTLAYCRDGLGRIRHRLPDRAAAIRYARGEYALLCLSPLSVLSLF